MQTYSPPSLSRSDSALVQHARQAVLLKALAICLDRLREACASQDAHEEAIAFTQLDAAYMNLLEFRKGRRR